MIGFRTLLYKEVTRFWKVAFQTVAAPVLTALLYLLVFSHTLDRHVRVFPDVPYTAFLVPGLAMMSALQNAFANASSSLIQSKITGNIVFLLLPPLSHREFFAAYMLASVLRGALVMVGAGMIAGVTAAAALSRLVSGLLVNVSATDPAIFIAAPVFLVVVGLVAAAVPALRATRIDPNTALRWQ